MAQTVVDELNRGVARDRGCRLSLWRWEAWQKQGCPEVMVYLCTRAYAPHTPDELAQWQRVLELQQALPEQQLWWRDATVPRFERLLCEHLTRLPRFAAPAPSPAAPNPHDSRQPLPMPPALIAGARLHRRSRHAGASTRAAIRSAAGEG